MTESYYYARTEEYRQILDRKKIGVHQVNDGGEVSDDDGDNGDDGERLHSGANGAQLPAGEPEIGGVGLARLHTCQGHHHGHYHQLAPDSRSGMFSPKLPPHS